MFISKEAIIKEALCQALDQLNKDTCPFYVICTDFYLQCEGREGKFRIRDSRIPDDDGLFNDEYYSISEGQKKLALEAVSSFVGLDDFLDSENKFFYTI